METDVSGMTAYPRCVILDGTLASAVALQLELLAEFEPGPDADIDLTMAAVSQQTLIILDPAMDNHKRIAATRILERVGMTTSESPLSKQTARSEFLLRVALAAQHQGARTITSPLFLGETIDEQVLADELDRAFLVSQLVSLECEIERFDVQTPLIDLSPQQLVELGVELLAPMGDAWIPAEGDEPWGGLNHAQWLELLEPALRVIAGAQGQSAPA